MRPSDVPALIRAALDPPAEKLLDAYYDPGSSFAGHTFDLFGTNEPDRISSDDLLAVSMLDVPIKPRALRRLTGPEGDTAAALLRGLPTDVDLWDASAAVLDAVHDADLWLDGLEGVGPVVASKIISRKRPRLVPVIDSVVLAQLGQPNHWYRATRRSLAGWLLEAQVLDRLSELAQPLPAEISPLPVLDVVLWMRGSGSRSAKRTRARNGL